MNNPIGYWRGRFGESGYATVSKEPVDDFQIPLVDGAESVKGEHPDIYRLEETLGAMEGKHGTNGDIRITMEERRLFARLLRKEIAQPPTPASGEQMEVVERLHPSVERGTDHWEMLPDPEGEYIRYEGYVEDLTAANERAERAERERDEKERQWIEVLYDYRKWNQRAETAEALNTTLSEALQAAVDEISAAMMDDNKQRFHRLNKLRHTIRTALAALPAKQGELKEDETAEALNTTLSEALEPLAMIAEAQRREQELNRELSGVRASYWEERKANIAAKRQPEAAKGTPINPEWYKKAAKLEEGCAVGVGFETIPTLTQTPLKIKPLEWKKSWFDGPAEFWSAENPLGWNPHEIMKTTTRKGDTMIILTLNGRDCMGPDGRVIEFETVEDAIAHSQIYHEKRARAIVKSLIG